MAYSDAVTATDPAPGAVLEALREDLRGDGRGAVDPPVASLDDQRDLAERLLPRYLRHLADTPGARRVLERYYRDEHDHHIDASDPDALVDAVGSLDRVIAGDALPLVSKEDLRERHGVEGAPRGDGDGDGPPSLVPDWVRHHPDEPYLMNSTTGTTGEPWHRAMTRNDAALLMACCARVATAFASDVGVPLDGFRLANPWPHPASRRYISETVDLLGVSVEEFSHEALRAGGDRERDEAAAVRDHLAGGEASCLVFPIQSLMQGRLGVAVRRGDVPLDVVVNAGAPFAARDREALEDAGATVYDLFGETEYPQLGVERTVHGVTGYDLPLAAQLNLVYDDGSGELRREGRGRFAYLPYGLEGHVVPGVYLSGVTGTLEVVDGHQLLRDVERVDDPGPGCAEA